MATMLPLNDPVKLKFWGVRGSIPAPGPDTVRYGGNTSCIEVRAGGELIILDAGTGIRPLGMSLLKEFKGEPLRLTLLITHTHWDHIQGFPFFVPAYNPKSHLDILGYEGARNGLEESLTGQMESPYFPISMKQMAGSLAVQELKDLDFNIGAIQVRAAYMNHPGICVGYRLFTPAGSISYMPDNEHFVRLDSQSADVAAVESKPDYVEYARSQEQKQIEFIQGSDILIIDSQYDTEEYPRHQGWGHSCASDSVMMGMKGNVKRLFLFHHDPVHDDDKVSEMLDQARSMVAKHGSSMIVEAASEGLEVTLESSPA